MPTAVEMVRQEGAPIVDFDHHSEDYAKRHVEIARDLLENSPVAWTEAYDGFWVLSRYDDVRFVLENWRLFSSENRIAEGDYSRRGGIIPPPGISLPLNESDPPNHTRLRMVEAPYFTPKYLRKWAEVAETYTRRAIDEIIETGRGDLVTDICGRIPVMTTLHLGGADPEEWEFYADPLAFQGGPGGEAYLAKVMEKLNAIIEDRRINPRDDMATSLANAVIEGRPLPTETAVGMLHIVLTGGFDTAISILCDGFDWLEANPDKRDWLRDHPEMIDNAADEFMRMWPPVLKLVRNATQDIQFGGYTVRAGDWVAVSIQAANHDPSHFENPYQVILARPNARDQLAFSAGNHRCLGAPLGRLELRHVFREVLRRLPDYRIDRNRAQRKASIHPTRGWETIPISFTPGKREGERGGSSGAEADCP